MLKTPKHIPAPDFLKLIAQSCAGAVMMEHRNQFQAVDRRNFIRDLMVEAVYVALKGQQQAKELIDGVAGPQTASPAEIALVDAANDIVRLRRNISALYHESEAGRLDLNIYLDGVPGV